MNIDVNRIPKDLPKTNALLFSFLMILDALKLNVRFNGKYERSVDKQLPAFEYAVNQWSVNNLVDGDVLSGVKEVEMNVVAALWKSEPPKNDCAVTWTKFPNGGALKEKPFCMDYFYDFDQWRAETFNELERIISMLVYKGEAFDNLLKRKNEYLADIFGWQILNNRVTYIYAVDSTSNQFYGIGATFTLKGKYSNCCPRPEDMTLTKKYFESVEFVFE